MNSRNDRDLAHRLILRAARKAPPALSERLEEEWLADLAARGGSASRLRLAIGCCWATTVIARDFRVPQLAGSGAAVGHKPLLDEHRYDLPLLSRRSAVFLAIAGLHVLLIYAFASGFAQHVTASLPTITHGIVIEEPHTPPPPPKIITDPLIAPKVVVPVIEGPTEHFNLQVDDGAPTETGGPTATTPIPHQAPAVVHVEGGPGKGFPNTEDYYPSASRRMAETGMADVHVCVDSQGRLRAEPVLAKSSGSRRLDDAALNLARAGSGHYRPSTEDGRPVDSCYPYRIRFALTN